jgi:hypothetical protein
MKNRLLTFAGALALTGVLGHFYAVPLMAQVRAALVKNLDERGRNPYMQTLACYSSTLSQCQVFFPVVPPNKRLVIEHVNASVDSPTALSVVDFSGNGTIQHVLMQLQGQDSAGNNIYVANQPFLTYFEAGQQPSYAVFAKTGAFQFVSAGMTITGYLVDLSQ